MDVWVAILSALTGYIFGSISFSRLVPKIASPDTDPTQIMVKDEQTGETFRPAVSASTVSMSLGWKTGCLISILDIQKVALPVLGVKLLYPDQYYFLITAVFALVGHNWPVFYRFRGGSGITAIYGSLVVIDPLAVIVPMAGGMLLGLVILRSFTLMFLLSLWLIIPWLWFRFHNPAYLWYGIAVNLIYLIAFARNIKEYLRPGVRRVSEREVMSQMPMGRGMIRMMEMLGLQKNKP
jgi:acyl phosphate:glycerol-3-phosphate acyltransferase